MGPPIGDKPSSKKNDNKSGIILPNYCNATLHQKLSYLWLCFSQLWGGDKTGYCTGFPSYGTFEEISIIFKEGLRFSRHRVENHHLTEDCDSCFSAGGLKLEAKRKVSFVW